MNIKYIIPLISSLILCFLLSSCNGDDNSTTYTQQIKDAQIYTFTISAEHNKTGDEAEIKLDKIRFETVNKTKFAIDQISGTIYNPDSMPYGTVLHNVLVTTTYNSYYGVSNVLVTTPDSIKGYAWNNSDSINLNKMPVSFTVTALSGTTKSYKLDVRIHKIDPDTLLWKQMPALPALRGNSKTLLINNTFYTYSQANGIYTLYISDRNNINWQQQEVSGLPSGVNAENIFEMNSVLYASDSDGKAYKSSDGKTWANVINDKSVVSILGVIPAENRSDDLLLLTINENGKYYFGKTKDMVSIELVEHISSFPADNQLPVNFPLQKCASYTNFSTDKNNRMLILTGGLDSRSNATAYSWLIKNVTGGLEITSFATNAPFEGEGLSIFKYDEMLYALHADRFYISSKWGSPWNEAPNKQMLDSSITKRLKQSVIVDSDNYIWILGGVSENGAYLNDVWRGRLNKLNP